MGSDTELSKICPILSITGREIYCKKSECMMWMQGDYAGYCSLTLLSFELDRLRRMKQKDAPIWKETISQ